MKIIRYVGIYDTLMDEWVAGPFSEKLLGLGGHPTEDKLTAFADKMSVRDGLDLSTEKMRYVLREQLRLRSYS